MRAPFAALLLAGCGGTPIWSTSFELAPGTELSVLAWKGTVRLRNGGSGKVDITVRGRPTQRLDKFTSEQRTPGKVAFSIQEAAAKDADLEIEIAAPPGVSISCACAEADVEVTGSWARLEVKTAGAITARVEGADSGELESRSGAVLYAAAKGPAGEFSAKAGRGTVTVRLPATWNGLFHGTTEAGKLDVPPHKNLQTIWDEDKKHVAGRVGPRGGDKELPTVWGSGRGDVSIRLEE